MQTIEVELSAISVSDSNTRKDLAAGTEDTGIDDLANSIREQGLLSPITVRTIADGRYDLIAGQRRLLAFRKLGMTTIPAIVRDDLADTDATIVSLVENVHRADMSPLDKARAYQSIHTKYGDYNRVAKETGVSVATVRKYLKLLNLAPSIQDKLTTSEGPAGVGTLSTLADTFDDPEEQEKVLKYIGGFKQGTQQEILKRSGGDIEKVPGLQELAIEGNFDTRMCRDGLCFSMPEEWKDQVRTLLAGGRTSAGQPEFPLPPSQVP